MIGTLKQPVNVVVCGGGNGAHALAGLGSHHIGTSIDDKNSIHSISVLTLYEGQREFVALHDQYVNDWISLNPFDL